jgi:hypothetical protein
MGNDWRILFLSGLSATDGLVPPTEEREGERLRCLGIWAGIRRDSTYESSKPSVGCATLRIIGVPAGDRTVVSPDSTHTLLFPEACG